MEQACPAQNYLKIVLTLLSLENLYVIASWKVYIKVFDAEVSHSLDLISYESCVNKLFQKVPITVNFGSRLGHLSSHNVPPYIEG